MKLNIGCGRDIRKGWINLDMVKSEGVDVVHNLEKFPYPFKNNFFEEIYAAHIIEHLENPYKFMRELWRISKKNAKIIIKTPHFSNGVLSWSDLTHKRTFSALSFYNFEGNKDLLSCQTIDKTKFKVNPFIRFGRFYKIVGLEWFFNRHINFYESFLCYIFPARELIFKLRVIK